MNAIPSEFDAQKSSFDAFSQMLQLLKLDASIYHNAKVCGDWRIKEHSIGATCFHMVTIGACVLDVPGQLQVVLGPGDLVIFPYELPHTMFPAERLKGKQRHVDYREAETIKGTGLVCGALKFQHIANRYVLDCLPPVFVLPAESNRDWLGPLLKLIMQESLGHAASSKVVLDRLAELLFICALRQYLTQCPGKVGMLAVYGHPQLSRVIDAVHAHPEREWTLTSMANIVALSRCDLAN